VTAFDCCRRPRPNWLDRSFAGNDSDAKSRKQAVVQNLRSAEQRTRWLWPAPTRSGTYDNRWQVPG
jgi:hypothetical protein